MGANISMDVSAGLADTAADTAAHSAFEDKLRQEVVLVPEDLADIYIEAATDADTAATTATTTDATDTDTATATETNFQSVASVVSGRNPAEKELKEETGPDRGREYSPFPDRAHNRATPRTSAADY